MLQLGSHDAKLVVFILQVKPFGRRFDGKKSRGSLLTGPIVSISQHRVQPYKPFHFVSDAFWMQKAP
jgi:hypothetical protein